MQKLLDAHPSVKPIEGELNAKRAEWKAERQRLIDSGDSVTATRYVESREKEYDAEYKRGQQQVIRDIQACVTTAAARRNLNLVLDSSGKTLNGIPLVLHASNLIDLTDDILHEINQ
jgi:Skp family chaperone for outer membrane proteins